MVQQHSEAELSTAETWQLLDQTDELYARYVEVSRVNDVVSALRASQEQRVVLTRKDTPTGLVFH